MDEYFNEDITPELFSEIELFIGNKHIEDLEISVKNEDFSYISVKLPTNTEYELEDILENLDEKNKNICYIITTIATYSDPPELKKYYVHYPRLNEFLYNISDPDFDEHIISISLTEQENDRYN